MSYYRESPSRRSPYHPSPIKVLPSERALLEEEMHLKTALRTDSENRRLFDEISILQIKLKKTQDLETKVQSLLKQNALLAQENDAMSHELSERRYEADRLRTNSVQLQQRDEIKVGQLSEINRSLQLEIDLLRKQKIQGSKLYEDHILKLQIMLEDKIKELDMINFRLNDTLNEKQVLIINFEEQKNKMKNQIVRLNHQKDKEISNTMDKNQYQKSYEIDNLKKNYSSQLTLLDDEVSKLKAANNYKNTQFENQIAENKAIRLRHSNEIKALMSENDNLRQRMLKLEELNRSEVQNIQGKYSDIHYKGTTDLKEHHSREAQILIDQIDKLQWITAEKNNEIQNLIREKRSQRNSAEQRQLALNSELDTVKNKLYLQQQKNAEDSHELMNKLNRANDKLLRDSENYHQRVVGFGNKINDLQAEIAYKQNLNQATKAQNEIKSKQQQRLNSELNNNLSKIIIELKDQKYLRERQNEDHEQYKQKKQIINKELLKKNNELQVNNEILGDKISRNDESSLNDTNLLKIQISSLQDIIKVIQGKLKEQSLSHSVQLSELSQKLMSRIEELKKTQKKTIQQLQFSKQNEIEILKRRIKKLEQQQIEMKNKLIQYIKMYESLQKYFVQPHEGSIFNEKSQNNIYEVLAKAIKSTIQIF